MSWYVVGGGFNHWLCEGGPVTGQGCFCKFDDDQHWDTQVISSLALMHYMDYHGHEHGYSYDYILSGNWSGSWMTGSASACGAFCFYTQNDRGWYEINLGSRTKPRIINGCILVQTEY